MSAKGGSVLGGQNPLNSIWQAPKEGVCFFTRGLCAITHHINFLSPGSCRVEHIPLKYHLYPCFIQPYKVYPSFSGVCINRFPFCIDMTCRRQLLTIEPNILASLAIRILPSKNDLKRWKFTDVIMKRGQKDSQIPRLYLQLLGLSLIFLVRPTSSGPIAESEKGGWALSNLTFLRFFLLFFDKHCILRILENQFFFHWTHDHALPCLSHMYLLLLVKVIKVVESQNFWH